MKLSPALRELAPGGGGVAVRTKVDAAHCCEHSEVGKRGWMNRVPAKCP